MSAYHRVGIIANLKKSEAALWVPRLRSWLRRHGLSVTDSLTLPRAEVIQRSDFSICLGGDGTLLSVAPLMQKKSIPILGVNLGHLGFLTEVKQAEVYDELSAFLKGKSGIEERLMIACTALNEKTGGTKRYTALNDIVVSREGLSRLVRLDVWVSGEKMTGYAGDGVIVSTPTGSTAYSLSAGASVVHPKLRALMITPICPHASALRSIAVSAEEKIRVRVRGKGGPCHALLTVDGQENMEVDDSFSIEITKAKFSLKLIKSSKRSYFATLREIFKFPS